MVNPRAGVMAVSFTPSTRTMRQPQVARPTTMPAGRPGACAHTGTRALYVRGGRGQFPTSKPHAAGVVTLKRGCTTHGGCMARAPSLDPLLSIPCAGRVRTHTWGRVSTPPQLGGLTPSQHVLPQAWLHHTWLHHTWCDVHCIMASASLLPNITPAMLPKQRAFAHHSQLAGCRFAAAHSPH